PYHQWMPNLEDLRRKVKANDSIAGILLINPDNPTGAAYPRPVLEEIVSIAREHDLFVICDEIYTHIVYNGRKTLHLSEVIGEACGIAMRGISKEVPWPGSRCGWIEVFNRRRDPVFDAYVNSLLAAKRLEVCSTTAPQMCIPRILGDSRYPGHLQHRAALFEARAREACGLLKDIPGVLVNMPSGAFYLTILFEDGVLNDRRRLPVENPEARACVEQLVQGVPRDLRFVYYLLGATGICVVPLSGFCCKRDGFRVTLLECDDAKRRWTFEKIANALRQYVAQR
ncbi:MAG TPA: aminotransferase class I/II-fold pyridoxal phosphate-dependent enzyme, partial [Phycisphaerae bacterium]|nr:aminotransferase class I/II-fold pyridoxal phosphate-dependent enzyme [Phycisphaerae bacterium]